LAAHKGWGGRREKGIETLFAEGSSRSYEGREEPSRTHPFISSLDARFAVFFNGKSGIPRELSLGNETP
jgi:hypothetical protein